MVFNATFNNISAISWQSVILVEETGVPGDTWRKPSTCRKSLTNFITYCCIEYTSKWAGFKLKTLVVIGTDCTGSCKSNYHTITTTTAPKNLHNSESKILTTVDSRYLEFDGTMEKIRVNRNSTQEELRRYRKRGLLNNERETTRAKFWRAKTSIACPYSRNDFKHIRCFCCCFFLSVKFFESCETTDNF